MTLSGAPGGGGGGGVEGGGGVGRPAPHDGDELVWVVPGAVESLQL